MIIKAIVLGVRDQGEDSKLMTVYSHELGKIEILVRGAKKVVSKLAQLAAGFFALMKLTVEPGKSHYHLLGGEVKKYFKAALSDYQKNVKVGSLLRTVDKMTKSEKPDDKIFDLLAKTLEKINSEPSKQLGMLGAAFTIKFLSLLGYKPEIKQCVVCRYDIKDEPSFFSSSRGGLICQKCSPKEANPTPVSAGTLDVLQKLLYKDLDFLLKQKFNPKDFSAAESIIGRFLEWQKQ